MHKSLVALVGAAGIGFAALTTPSTANAGCFGCAVGVGVFSGLVVGTIVGNAIANSPPPGYYPPPPGYYYPPPPGAYYAPPPAYAQLAPGCRWAPRRVWVEGVGYDWRTVQVCP